MRSSMQAFCIVFPVPSRIGHSQCNLSDSLFKPTLYVVERDPFQGQRCVMDPGSLSPKTVETSTGRTATYAAKQIGARCVLHVARGKHQVPLPEGKF